MKKKIYETPLAEALEVCSEGMFCLSGESTEGEVESWDEEDVEWDEV